MPALLFLFIEKTFPFCFYLCYDCTMFNQTERVMTSKIIDGLIAVAFVVAGFALISAVSIAYVVAIHPSTWQ